MRLADGCAVATLQFAVWNELAPEIEADYNQWYVREHIPEEQLSHRVVVDYTDATHRKTLSTKPPFCIDHPMRLGVS